MKSVLMVFVITLFAGISMPQKSLAEKIYSTSNEVLLEDDVEYMEIESKELPEKVINTLNESFSGYAVSKAYKGTDNTFKVVLSKDGDSIVAYFNSEGEFLKKETE